MLIDIQLVLLVKIQQSVILLAQRHRIRVNIIVGIDDEKAEKVAVLWDQFCRDHKDEIFGSKDAAFIDDDLYNEYNG